MAHELDLKEFVHERFRRVDEKLDRAGIVEPHGPANGEGRIKNLLPCLGLKIERRRYLDHFLMPALHRAIALE